MHTRPLPGPRSRLATALLGVALLLLGAHATTAQAETLDPQLSIAVDDGSASARSGDKISYTLTVTNLGTTKIKDLRVSQSVPQGASVLSVGSRGRQAPGKISWSVALAPTGKATMRTTMALGATPESALRLASVACAQVSAEGPPLVCATDSDQLPAGAAVEAAQAGAADASGSAGGRTPWFVGGGAGLVVLLLGALLLVRRHRHGGTGPVAQRAATSEVG